MNLKVCGLKHPTNLLEICALGPTMIGLIFVPSSSRYVEVSVPLMNALSKTNCQKVGVFVNATKEEIVAKVRLFNLRYVQLHGDESPEMVNELSQQIKVIKAFSVDDSFDFKLDEFAAASMFLFDTKGSRRGGNGEKFDWTLLDRYEGKTPFMLSGGITLQDAEEINKISHPAFAGVDINSGFESYPGIKKVDEVEAFKDQLHEVYS